ncbi:MAG: class I SAM-dependent methyltransferase [Patescibacteria group bacterium]
MNLSEYHQQQAAETFGKMLDKVKEKDAELEAVLKAVPVSINGLAHVAVLGCGDKRYIPYHQLLFEDHLGTEVDMTTFDITIEHLAGVPGVVQHDCTQPLPGGPYDLTFAHVLLKFISVDKQLAVLKNSYNALRSGGIAIHIIDTKEIEADKVPVSILKEQLAQEKIEVSEVPVKYGIALVLRKA